MLSSCLFLLPLSFNPPLRTTNRRAEPMRTNENCTNRAVVVPRQDPPHGFTSERPSRVVCIMFDRTQYYRVVATSKRPSRVVCIMFNRTQYYRVVATSKRPSRVVCIMFDRMQYYRVVATSKRPSRVVCIMRPPPCSTATGPTSWLLIYNRYSELGR